MFKKFLLIILGIILSLVILECGLRVAGFTISSYQQYKNNKALKNKSQYTIMCLGESTTARQYPVQLQQILNKKYPDKFSVIDCGISGTNLESILDLLDDNINKYKPNIVICMMGINNKLTLFNEFDDTDNTKYIEKSKDINLKIYKLFILLKKHILSFYIDNKLFADEKLQNDLNYISYLKNSGNFEKVAEMLEKLLIENPNDENIYRILANNYIELRQEKKSYELSINAINNKTNWDKTDFYRIVFDMNVQKQNTTELKYYADKAINNDINIFKSDIKFWLYTYIKNIISKEQRDKIFNIMLDKTDTQYAILSIDSIDNKDYQKAKEYFDKAEELRLKFPNIRTYKLYKLIVKKLIDNNVKVICMQYPVRSVLSLQEQLKDKQYYDRLTFISNEKLFKDALMNKNYNDLFKDQFAGDFGHCTNLGNTMIAKNIVYTLENILDLKQN